jgi:hypothetical protein
MAGLTPLGRAQALSQSLAPSLKPDSACRRPGYLPGRPGFNRSRPAGLRMNGYQV